MLQATASLIWNQTNNIHNITQIKLNNNCPPQIQSFDLPSQKQCGMQTKGINVKPVLINNFVTLHINIPQSMCYIFNIIIVVKETRVTKGE